MRLKGKAAIVTGSSHGIGRAIALRFASEGAKVAIADLEKDALEEVKALIEQAGGEVLSIGVDVRSTAQIDELIEGVEQRWGGIDVLVNCAGICSPAPFLEMTEADWDRHMDINLKGAFLVSQRAARVMVRNGIRGAIIQMSSVNGMAAEGDQAHYNASKGGLNLLMMSMALDLASHGIRVNSLCPGMIATRLTKPIVDNPELHREYVKSIPMGMIGQPEDIADAALFLASSESRYMTGQCLVVDGGQLMKLS
ncbi:SDR family NAD(P)-dependent oxidoreductase [Paenibacillus chungangensis]|uniref:SDR family NAD(P)-dependent oxidoreductase n=1 Tax=Paenibacillus chungangensis TaxID=696535 RepID=A0ABW3HT58_9BACL